MKILVVDDEPIALRKLIRLINEAEPSAECESFNFAEDALGFIKTTKIDIAFLDIQMQDMNGLKLAEELQKDNPKINIIFCTGYSEYSLDAHNLFCSAYLMKPITDEKIAKALENLRYPVSSKLAGLFVQCFGNFEVYKDGTPIKFKHKKTKELFAYLIDRRGASVSTKEIMAVLYEENDRESYVRNLRADLNNTFEMLGLSEALVHSGGDVGVNQKQIDCDYYSFLDGQKELFQGEYMTQYSFAEKTLGWLINNN